MGLVENTIFLVPQVNGEQAIAGSFAVKAERAVTTVNAILQMHASITFFAIDAFIAVLALVYCKAINGVFTARDVITEITIFRRPAAEAKVTVF